MEEYIADLQEQLITAQHRFMKMHRDLCFTGLRKSEFVMLEIIERENGNREQGVLASDIAKRLRITAPAVSKMLRSMEEKGYVERRVDEKDRRNTRVSITPDGKEAEQQVRRQMQEFITGVIERLGGGAYQRADSFNEPIHGDHAGRESEQKKKKAGGKT